MMSLCHSEASTVQLVLFVNILHLHGMFQSIRPVLIFDVSRAVLGIQVVLSCRKMIIHLKCNLLELNVMLVTGK